MADRVAALKPPDRGSPYGWKNRGIFAVGRMGLRGLRVSNNLAQGLAIRPQGSEIPGGRGPLIAGCRCPAGVKGRHGHSLGERGCPCPERVPGRARGLAAEAPIASPCSYHGVWSCSPSPRSLVLSWHSASVGVPDVLGCVVLGKMRGPLGVRESFQFQGHDPRDPVNLV